MKIYSLAILAILVILTNSCTDDDYKGNRNCNQLINEPYNFPITPSQPEWSELQTTEQRYNAVQIPRDTLYCLTDEALVETCINYPLYLECAMRSDLDIAKGFNIMINNFNGLTELFERESALKLVINRYLSEDMYQFAETHGKSRLSYFYMFLSMGKVISILDNEQRYEFIEKTIDKINLIENESPKVLCCNNVELTCYYIIANALYGFEYKPFITYFKLAGLNNVGSIPPDKIYEYAINFLNQND